MSLSISLFLSLPLRPPPPHRLLSEAADTNQHNYIDCPWRGGVILSFFLLTSSGELAAHTTCTNQLERFFSSLVDLSDGKVRWDHSLSRHACVRMDDRDDDASFMWAQKVYSCHYASNALIGGMSYFFLSSSIISESCLTGIIAIVGHSRGAQPV